MADNFIPFWRLLVSAEEQLHWGTDPKVLENAASALLRVQPGSVVADQLLARSASLKIMQSRLPGHSARLST